MFRAAGIIVQWSGADRVFVGRGKPPAGAGTRWPAPPVVTGRRPRRRRKAARLPALKALDLGVKPVADSAPLADPSRLEALRAGESTPVVVPIPPR